MIATMPARANPTIQVSLSTLPSRCVIRLSTLPSSWAISLPSLLSSCANLLSTLPSRRVILSSIPASSSREGRS